MHIIQNLISTRVYCSCIDMFARDALYSICGRHSVFGKESFVVCQGAISKLYTSSPPHYIAAKQQQQQQQQRRRKTNVTATDRYSKRFKNATATQRDCSDRANAREKKNCFALATLGRTVCLESNCLASHTTQLWAMKKLEIE